MRFGSTTRVTFPAHALDGTPQEQTGLLHVPLAEAPEAGWPVVVYGHMTTGASQAAAPSLAAPGHVEWRRISQGVALCARLLKRGIAVLRPDYEGIGGGPDDPAQTHPYLIAPSLAESMLALSVVPVALGGFGVYSTLLGVF